MTTPPRLRRVPPTSVLDDRILDGLEEHEDPQTAALLGGLRALAVHAATPSAALADVLRGGIGPELVRAPAAPAASPGRRIARVVVAKVAGLGLVAQVGVGVAAASAVAVGAAVTDQLPGPAQDAVAGWVERVSPFDLPHRSELGQEVAQDAQDDPGGVVGPDVASEVAVDMPSDVPPADPSPSVPPDEPPVEAPPGHDVVEDTPAADHATPPYEYWRDRAPQTPADAGRPSGNASPAPPGTPAHPAPSQRPEDAPSDR